MKQPPGDIDLAYKPSSPAFRYQNYPFYWNARVGNRYAQVMEATLKPLGLTITGWRICLILSEHKTLSVSDISTHSAVKLSTVTKTVYSMEDKGLLRVARRKSDARVTEVSLTAAGTKTIKNVVAETAEFLDRALENFDNADIERLNELLARLFSNLGESK